VIRRDGQRSYRLLRADNVIDGMDLAAVERLLGSAGLDLVYFVEIKDKDDSTGGIGAA